MPALEGLQAQVMLALDRGPDFLPDHLFAGTRSRVLAGMKVHANTISHARLVALEDTFPRTRQWLGHERFIEHSRLFLDQPEVTARNLARIGQDFPSFLATTGVPCAAADLARFEWLWLDAYHAAEASPLRLADLAGLDPAALMEIPVKAHPAASIAQFVDEVPRLLGVEVNDDGNAPYLLLTRPVAEVLIAPADPAMQAMFAKTSSPITICNLLACLSEPGCKAGLAPDALMARLIALLESGALQRVE